MKQKRARPPKKSLPTTKNKEETKALEEELLEQEVAVDVDDIATEIDGLREILKHEKSS